MEADAESLHMQSTFMIQVLQNDCDKIMDDKSPKESNENWLDVAENTDAEKNELIKLPSNNQNDSNEFQERTCNRTSDEVLRKGSISENVEEILPEESTSNSKKAPEENDAQTAFNQRTVSSSSSSDEEILQTRFIVHNNNMIYDNDHNSNNNSISSERISDKDSTPENDSEIKKTSPIIIQAIAYDENNAVINSDNTKLNFEMNNHVEVTKTDMASGNSLSVEADNSNTEIESSYMQNSTENDNELLDSNSRKDANEVLQQEMIEPVTRTNDNNSSALDFRGSNGTSADFIVQDFLNGSFDLNTYQSERSSRKIMEKGTVSEKKQFEKGKPSTNTMQKNREDILESNKHRKIYGLFTATNEAKQSNLHNSNNDFFENSYDVSMKSLKRKKTGRQTNQTKKARITAEKKSSTKDLNITPGRTKQSNFKPYSRLENKFSYVKGQRKQENLLFNHDENNTILNSFNRKNEDIKKNKKNNTAKRKNYKQEKMSNALLYKNSPFRNSRNKRNSSLIASRKIKEIEKLENSESHEEIYLDSDEEHINTDDAYFTSHNVKKNVDKYTNMFQSGKINNKYQIENKIKSDNFWNKNISDATSSEGLQSYSVRREKTENSRVTRSNRKYKKMFKDAFDSCSITVKTPLNEDDKETTNKFFTSDTNLSDDCFIQENEDLHRNPSSSRKKVNKQEHKNNESVKSKMLGIRKHTFDKNASQKSNVQSIITYKGAVTRSRKKTWDMLEKELLGELDDIPLSNNVCKTVILQKEKLVKKQNIKDADLYTVSNRSMVQTISKSKKGNKYNMQYEIQNTESKYLETRANNVKNYLNIINKTHPGKIIPTIPKNTTILERTIAAMERCTAQFIEPQVNIIENEQKQGMFQFEDTFDNSDINQETKFHTNIMTFMENENEQYYQNEIVGYLKKSTRRKNNMNLSKKCNLSKTVDNFSDGNNEYGNSNDAEHLEKNSFITKNNLLENTEGNLRNESKALSLSGEKHTNPWNKLMRKLNLQQNNEEDRHPKDISKNKESMKKSFSHRNNLKRYKTTHPGRNDNILVTMVLDEEEINKQDKMKDIEGAQEVSKLIPNKKNELLANITPASSNGNNEYGNSNDAEHLKKNSFATKSNLLENNEEGNLRNKSKALSLSGEKHTNPWNKLMRKLNLKQNNEEDTHPKDISKNEKGMKKSFSHRNNLKRYVNTYPGRNDNILVTMVSDEEEITKQDKIKDIKGAQEVSELIPNKENELLVNFTPASSNSDLADSYTLNTDFGSQRNSDKRSKSDTNCVIRNLETPVEKMKKNERKVTKIQKVRKSPKFKLQKVKDGSLKFKRHSCRSSSITNSSEEFTQSKQNQMKHLKSNNHSKEKSNKAREKYKKYLKKLFNTEDKLLKGGMTSDHDRIKSIEVENKVKEKRKMKRKLIAEDEEDIFSLSSSDSEVDYDKNQRHGLLYEVFDE